MTSYVSADLRRLVALRAKQRCEYCLIDESDTYLGCQVDHIVSEKHGGPTAANNLAYACTLCNRAKGTDIGSIAVGTAEFTRFFNPRTDRWTDHFAFKGTQIMPLTPIGETTARILRFNEPDRLLERESLQKINRFPPVEAIGESPE